MLIHFCRILEQIAPQKFVQSLLLTREERIRAWKIPKYNPGRLAILKGPRLNPPSAWRHLRKRVMQFFHDHPNTKAEKVHREKVREENNKRLYKARLRKYFSVISQLVKMAQEDDFVG